MQRRIVQRDKFGAIIECRFCKARGFEYAHHPMTCKRCYTCGSQAHLRKQCHNNPWREEKQRNVSRFPKSPNKFPSMRRVIYRNNFQDLEPNQPVAIDVEKVDGFGKLLPGWIVVVRYPLNNHQRQHQDQVVFSAKIRQLPGDVNRYSTLYSGLAQIDLSEQSKELTEIIPILTKILSDRLVIGIGLEEDLKQIQMDKIVKKENRFEFHDHFFDSEHQPISLKALTFAFMNKRIQEYKPDFDVLLGHDPVVDARYTMMVYRLYTLEKSREAFGPLNWDSSVGKMQVANHQWVRNLITYAEEMKWIPTKIEIDKRKKDQWSDAMKRRYQKVKPPIK